MDRAARAHPLCGDTQEADDLLAVVLQSADALSKLALRACCRRLARRVAFDDADVQRFALTYFERRKPELRDAIRALFEGVGLRDGVGPCYPFFLIGSCDCATPGRVDDAGRSLQTGALARGAPRHHAVARRRRGPGRHHDGDRGSWLPARLAFLRRLGNTDGAREGERSTGR